MSLLFESIKLRELEIKNRIWVSPMCQYSSIEGFPNDWHLVHLGSRAVGGAGLVMTEATAITPTGRLTPHDAGIWSDEHISAYRKIADFIKSQGATAGMQIAHGGRKASTDVPWRGGKLLDGDDGWTPLAASAIAFSEDYAVPKAMTKNDIEQTVNDFAEAARRGVEAGFQVIEIHAAHGYLLHNFLSPLSNKRDDEYGGSLENRLRFPLEIVQLVRKKVPEHLPLFVRISATDWAGGGWDLEQSIEFSKRLKEIGVDLIDVSSGGLVADAKIPVAPNYQVPYAAEIRKQTGVLTAAVGLITQASQAEEILQNESADAIFMAREFLRNPYFPQLAAKELNSEISVPNQYGRAKR